MDYDYPDLEQPPKYLWLGQSRDRRNESTEVIDDVNRDFDVAEVVRRGSRSTAFESDESLSDPDFEP